MLANTSVSYAPETTMTFRPFDILDLNGMWLYDNEFPVTECRNARETRGWWQALHADAECSVYDAPGYAECIERVTL